METVKKSLNDDKAQDVTIISLMGKTSFADYMVIATGTSKRQVVNMATHLCKKLKAEGLGSVGTEGLAQGDWVLIDGGDVVIHLFRPEIRAFYDLDKLWGAPIPQPGQAASARELGYLNCILDQENELTWKSPSLQWAAWGLGHNVYSWVGIYVALHGHWTYKK